MRRLVLPTAIAIGCGPNVQRDPASDETGDTSADASTSGEPVAATTIATMTTDPSSTSDDTTGEPPPVCALGSSPGGELLWSREGVTREPDPLATAYALAALPDGDFVTVGTWSDGGHWTADVLLGVFSPEGELRWWDRYDGAASLADVGLDVAVDGDGFIHVLLRETLSEVWYEGYPHADDRLVLLRYGPDGTKIWRYEWALRRGEQFDDYPFGALGIANGDEPVIVEWESYGVARARRFDRWGNQLDEIVLDVLLDPWVSTEVRSAAVAPNGALAVAGTGFDGDEFGWIEYFGPDGSRWSTADVEPNIAIAFAHDGRLAVASNHSRFSSSPVIRGTLYEIDGSIAWNTVIDAPANGGRVARVFAHCSDAVAIAGTIYDDPPPPDFWLPRSDLWLVQLGPDGQAQWQERYSFPPIHHGDPYWLTALGDGDWIVSGSYRTDGSAGREPWLGRFRGGM